MTRVIKRGLGDAGEARTGVRPVELAPVCVGVGSGGAGSVEDLLGKAQQEALIIVRTAEAEADATRQRAYEEGFASGVRDSVAVAEELIRRLESDLAGLAEEKARLVDDVEPQVLKLCIEAVEKVIRHEIRTDPSVVMRVLKACLRRVKDFGDVSVRVSPQEIEYVKARREELEAAVEGARSLRLVSDRRVSPGGCVVESPSGTFDARIPTQIERISKALTTPGPDGQPGPGPGDQ